MVGEENTAVSSSDTTLEAVEILQTVQEYLRPLAVHAEEIVEAITDSVPEMAPGELADLEREAGRPLCQRDAHHFRIRKLQRQLVAKMLGQAARSGGDK